HGVPAAVRAPPEELGHGFGDGPARRPWRHADHGPRGRAGPVACGVVGSALPGQDGEGRQQRDQPVPGRANHLRSLPRPLQAVILGVPAAGILLAAAAAFAGGFGVAQPWRWLVIPVCFAGVALAERYPVKIGPEQKVNLGALPCLVAALLLPPGVGPATAGLSGLVANAVMRRTWPESACNAG